MHPGYIDRPRYSGSHLPPHAMPMAYPYMPAAMQGFCQGCCHPKSMCCCGKRECRKEAKELLVQPTIGRNDLGKDAQAQASLNRMAFAAPFMASIVQPATAKESAKSEKAGDFAMAAPFAEVAAVGAADLKLGLGTAFIGGGCCVHLSIEYTPSTPTVVSAVLILVRDSEGTLLAWYKVEQPGAGYQIKECVVTTKPGADLAVIVLNMTARVRWCEIFSC